MSMRHDSKRAGIFQSAGITPGAAQNRTQGARLPKPLQTTAHNGRNRRRGQAAFQQALLTTGLGLLHKDCGFHGIFLQQAGGKGFLRNPDIPTHANDPKECADGKPHGAADHRL